MPCECLDALADVGVPQPHGVVERCPVGSRGQTGASRSCAGGGGRGRLNERHRAALARVVRGQLCCLGRVPLDRVHRLRVLGQVLHGRVRVRIPQLRPTERRSWGETATAGAALDMARSRTGGGAVGTTPERTLTVMSSEHDARTDAVGSHLTAFTSPCAPRTDPAHRRGEGQSPCCRRRPASVVFGPPPPQAARWRGLPPCGRAASSRALSRPSCRAGWFDRWSNWQTKCHRASRRQASALPPARPATRAGTSVRTR